MAPQAPAQHLAANALQLHLRVFARICMAKYLQVSQYRGLPAVPA